MVADPRISDKELAAINAAAVTREYNVQPHLGMESLDDLQEAALSLGAFLQTTAPSLPLTGGYRVRMCGKRRLICLQPAGRPR